MILQELDRMKDFILNYNKYFGAGYANAWQEIGYVFASTPAGRASIFPNDRKGDYFYLRNGGRASFDTKASEQVYDGAISVVGCTIPLFLVAVVKDADEIRLLMNLVNTLQAFSLAIALKNTIWSREEVVMQELKGADEEDLAAALKNLKTEAIVSLEFNYRIPLELEDPNCITEPCKSC